jgi:hypothetical protein
VRNTCAHPRALVIDIEELSLNQGLDKRLQPAQRSSPQVEEETMRALVLTERW